MASQRKGIGLNVRVLLGVTVVGLLLQGCAPKAALVETPPPPPHYGPPPARTCTVAPFTLAEGASTAVAMTVSSDGGYCAIHAAQTAGGPFDVGIEPTQPGHGTAHIIKYNGQTSIEYVARAGYVGPDKFVAELIRQGQPGYTTLTVSVSAIK